MKRLTLGFTIVEVATVIAIIGVLFAMTIIVYGNIQRQSRDTQRQSDAAVMKGALAKYYDQNGEYPSVCTGGDNSTCSAGNLATMLVPAYLSTIPVDPVNDAAHQYQYIRGSAMKSYAIKVSNESQSACKTGLNMDETNWWGGASATPDCSF